MVRPVHFVSYPKSGRTWIRYMLTCLGAEHLYNFHHDGFEFNDGSLPALDFDISRRRALIDQGERFVYLARDPRDVMVSLYHQVTGRFQDFFDYPGDLSAFIRHPYFGAANLARFRSMWRELGASPNVHCTTYEAFHSDPESALNAVIEHARCVCSPAKISAAVDAASIDKMRQVELSGDFPKPWLRTRNGHPKVRQGKVGTFAQVLSESDIEYLDRIFGDARAKI